ncbi:MAG: ribonuclease P protein component [Rikenellaceae bacterium]|nr:ribonuclease P protein component [Rikenellaceae bacterium]
MSEQTLTRTERLRSLKVIRRLFEEGRSGFVYPFRYLWLAAEDEGATEIVEASTTEIVEASATEVVSGGVEVLFSVPKRFLKRANKRNLVRRRAKEAYRLGKGEIVAAAGKRKVRIALVYSTKKIHEYRTINNAVERILGEISRNL